MEERLDKIARSKQLRLETRQAAIAESEEAIGRLTPVLRELREAHGEWTPEMLFERGFNQKEIETAAPLAAQRLSVEEHAPYGREPREDLKGGN